MKLNMLRRPWTVAILMLLAVSLALTGCGAKDKKAGESAAANAEPVHLVWWVYAENNPPLAADEVLEKVNAMSAEKIGVTVEMRYMNEEQFAQAMDAGEPYDMTFTATGATALTRTPARAAFTTSRIW